ncbi:hypothetical protein Acsp01_65970 [Actinoplanes sp. NBRC 101535]|nr:hypothetical protein Acsp01_65970 [Actinoplanes sp. NBRC 101535]
MTTRCDKRLSCANATAGGLLEVGQEVATTTATAVATTTATAVTTTTATAVTTTTATAVTTTAVAAVTAVTAVTGRRLATAKGTA